MRRWAVVFIAVASLNWVAFATPSISVVSGTFTHRSTVTITGVSFSTFTMYAGASHGIAAHSATIWKDNEDGVLESDRMSVVAGRTDHWSILSASTENRTNSSYSLYEFYVSNRFPGLKMTQSSATTTGIYYESFWMKTPDQSTNCGPKFERLYYGTSSSIDNIYFLTGACDGWTVRAFSECAGGGCTPAPTTQYGSASKQFQDNTWHRIDIYRNVYDGEATVYKDMNRVWTNRTSCGGLSDCRDQQWMDASRYAPQGRTWEIGHEVESPTGGPGSCLVGTDCPGSPTAGSWKFDDIYMSYNMAHVELCSESTWTEVRSTDTVSHCETQIPLAWSDSEIQVSLNQGAFISGTTAYMYVVTRLGTTGSDDVNSNGFTLVIGGTEVPPEPGPEPEPTSDGVLVGCDGCSGG